MRGCIIWSYSREFIFSPKLFLATKGFYLVAKMGNCVGSAAIVLYYFNSYKSSDLVRDYGIMRNSWLPWMVATHPQSAIGSPYRNGGTFYWKDVNLVSLDNFKGASTI